MNTAYSNYELAIEICIPRYKFIEKSRIIDANFFGGKDATFFLKYKPCIDKGDTGTDCEPSELTN